MLLVEDGNIVCLGQQLPFPRKQPQNSTADKAGLPTALPLSFSEALLQEGSNLALPASLHPYILCSSLLREQSPQDGQCSSSPGWTETQDSAQFRLHLDAWVGLCLNSLWLWDGSVLQTLS